MLSTEIWVPPLPAGTARKVMNTAHFGTMRVKSADFGYFAYCVRGGGQDLNLGGQQILITTSCSTNVAINRISGPSISRAKSKKQVLNAFVKGFTYNRPPNERVARIRVEGSKVTDYHVIIHTM